MTATLWSAATGYPLLWALGTVLAIGVALFLADEELRDRRQANRRRARAMRRHPSMHDKN
jgi:hypothetical protein